MTNRRNSSSKRVVLALVVLVSLVAAACGSGVSTETGASPLPLPVPAPGAGTDGNPLLPPAPDANASSNPQHGLTLDEWGETRGGPQSDGSGDVPSAEFASISWDELIPVGQSGEEIFARFKDRLANVEYGTDEANRLYDRMDAEFDRSAINPELNGLPIRLAGFVAPLTFDDEVVTEFLLVPTFGACIHVPPPPPNQTVMVTIERSEGLTYDESWGAVWVEGTLQADTMTTDLATASYTLSGVTAGVYNDF